MTLRSLSSIVLKIIGLFFIKDLLDTLPQLITVVGFIVNAGDFPTNIFPFLSFALIPLSYIIFSYAFIFKTEVIIDKLKLANGNNQETVSINIHRSVILSISIIIIGGLLVVEGIPNLCQQLFRNYEGSEISYPKFSDFILPITKIIIGLVLITKQRQIVNLIELKRKR